VIEPSRPDPARVASRFRDPARRGACGRRYRAGLERLEGRSLMSAYAPAVANYGGWAQAELAVFRRNDAPATRPLANSALLIQSPAPIGYELGLSGSDTATPGDFEGIGKADPAVYGFLGDASYGLNYGSDPNLPGPHPFPQGSGRFAYIPLDGNYPPHRPGALDGTMDTTLSKVVVVNLGVAGDLPAVAAYDADHKAEFAVYEPAAGRFLYYPSATFDPNAEPGTAGHRPVAVPLGGPGDVPAPADYQGTGHADFAVYDPAAGRFLVRPSDGGPTVVVPLGGPGDVPVSADFEGVGHADFAVYDPAAGHFLVKPASGGATVVVAVGSPGDTPAVASYHGDGHADFATFTPGTLRFHIRRSSDWSYEDRAFTNPDAVPVQRTDDAAMAEHRADLARPGSPDVVFLGDSITDFWARNFPQSWAAESARFHAVDDGIAGDSTQNVLLRVESGELASHPKVVVLLVGTNDFGYHDRTPRETADSLRVLIDAIHARSPGSSLLLMGLFPRGQDSPADSAAARQVNEAIAGDIQAFDATYLPALARPFAGRAGSGDLRGDYSVDLTTALNTDATNPADHFANPAAFVDLLHPDAAGYAAWSAGIATPLRLLLGLPATPADFEGTGRTDPSVYLPSIGSFAVRPSAGGADRITPFGVAGAGQSIPVSGDYDGDGKSDLAVYLPSIGSFAVRPSAGGADRVTPFGVAGAGQSIPVSGDFDGDGKSDLAVYLPSIAAFAYRPSAGGPDVVVPFGIAGAGQSIPAPGDYDGSGKTDLAVYLPSIGSFAVRPSAGGADRITPFGIAGAGQSIPMPGDYDGSGKTELAVYLPSLGALAYRPAGGGPDRFIPFGIAGAGGSIPAPGDYDGDGKTDPALYLPSIGALAYRPSAGGPDVVVPFGIAGAGGSLPTAAAASGETTVPPAAAAAPKVPSTPTRHRPTVATAAAKVHAARV